jgi:hypothetical protein
MADNFFVSPTGCTVQKNTCAKKIIFASKTNPIYPSSPSCEKYLFRFSENYDLYCASRARTEGRFAVVTNVGAGCDGRLGFA